VPRRSTVLGLVPGIQFPLLNAARGDGDWPLHSEIGTSPNWNDRAALQKWLINQWRFRAMAGAKEWDHGGVSNLADGSLLLRVRICYTAIPPRGRVTYVPSPSTFCSEIRKPFFFLLSIVDYYKDRECIHATITRRLYACCSLVLDSHRLSRRSEPCPPDNCLWMAIRFLIGDALFNEFL